MMGPRGAPTSPGLRSSLAGLRREASGADGDPCVQFSTVLNRRPLVDRDLRRPQPHGDPFPLPMPAL
eukprot:14845911-Heterocapsa_arctica.AAC.1